jgi:hypothetical protein
MEKVLLKIKTPGVADGGPAGADRPTGVDAGHIVLMGPDIVHPGDIEAFERLIKLLIGNSHFLDPLLKHGTSPPCR